MKLVNFARQAYRLATIVIAVLDFFCLQIALLIGYWLWITFPWHGNYQFFSEFSLILWILPPIGIVVFKAVGLYKPEMGVIGVQEQSLIFKAIWIVYIIAFAFSFFYREIEFSRLATFYSIFFAIFLISLERFFARHLFIWLNQKGAVARQALIFGAGYHGQRLERWIRQSPQLGIRVVGYLDDEIERLVKKPESPPWLGTLSDLAAIAPKKKIALLFIAHRKLEESRVVEIFLHCRSLGIQCWAIPSLYQFHVERAQLQNIGGIPLLGFRGHFGLRSYLVVKRVLDILISSILIILTLPLSVLIALGIVAEKDGPLFFRQIRVGLNGKKFNMIKFRTMKGGVKKDDISPELKKDAKAISPFRAFLRKSGFDELPQMINVLRGDMSLVGPRPEMPFIVEKYGPLEKERLTVKPGITGLWQISEDRKRLLIHENMDYDLYYVEHFGFNLDLAIMVKTILTVLKRILEGSRETRRKV